MNMKNNDDDKQETKQKKNVDENENQSLFLTNICQIVFNECCGKWWPFNARAAYIKNKNKITLNTKHFISIMSIFLFERDFFFSFFFVWPYFFNFFSPVVHWKKAKFLGRKKNDKNGSKFNSPHTNTHIY